MSKYIFIKESEATRKLENLADSNELMLVLKIPANNVAQAMLELANIEEENWISSELATLLATLEEGNITDSILLPKEAINA